MDKIKLLFQKLSPQEQEAKNNYINRLAKPIIVDEAKSLYPDVYVDFTIKFSDAQYVDASGKVLTIDELAEDMIDVFTEHHREVLYSDLRLTFLERPFKHSTELFKAILKEYSTESGLSKDDYLKYKYKEWRSHVDSTIRALNILENKQEYSYNDICELFSIDSPQLFQEVMTTYHTAFLCEHLPKRNPEDKLKDRYNRLYTALKDYLTHEKSEPDDLFEIFDCWYDDIPLPKKEMSKKPPLNNFNLNTHKHTEFVCKAMEELGITHDGVYSGGERSKSILRGFVEGCVDEGILPQISRDDLCKAIADHIQMTYPDRLKDTGLSSKMRKKTINHIQKHRK